MHVRVCVCDGARVSEYKILVCVCVCPWEYVCVCVFFVSICVHV